VRVSVTESEGEGEGESEESCKTYKGEVQKKFTGLPA
jgi:hypothetical protein